MISDGHDSSAPDGLRGEKDSALNALEQRMQRIEALLTMLVERETVKDWYSTEEFAHAVGRAEFTVREWCRLGRIRARKKEGTRGPHAEWAISHEELLRHRRDGLLPAPKAV